MWVSQSIAQSVDRLGLMSFLSDRATTNEGTTTYIKVIVALVNIRHVSNRGYLIYRHFYLKIFPILYGVLSRTLVIGPRPDLLTTDRKILLGFG